MPEYIEEDRGYVTPCHIWQGTTNDGGYGVTRANEHGSRGAHRVSYEEANGPVPVGLVLDHLCEQPPCIRPDHLEPVPERVNILRSNGTGAINARRTECVSGHPFDVTNTYVTPDGRRQCRTCRRTAQHNYTARRASV